MYRNLCIEIDKKNIENNIINILKEVKYKYNIGVVKGNVYGHGLGIIDSMILAGINYFAVSNLDEAIHLRSKTKLPILILEPIEKDYLKEAYDNNITISINSLDYYNLIKDTLYKLKVHLKIDSGMNRLGVNKKDDVNFIFKNIKNTNLYLEGIFTHFATSGILDKQYDNQVERFKNLTSDINLSNVDIVHVDRSVTALAHEKLSFTNGVRLGLVMYGFDQIINIPLTFMNRLRNIKRNYIRRKYNISKTIPYRDFNLKQTFTLKTKILQIKDVKCGSHIGYGTACVANADMRVAIIDCGYMDGISKKRAGSNVEINGKLYPIIGDIGMTMSFVHIDESVNMDDEVIIIGGRVSVKYVANYLNTSAYEVINMLDSSIEKIYK